MNLLKQRFDMHIRQTIFLALLLASVPMNAQDESPLWLRKSCISPDGKTIAFSYKGDIFTIPQEGGEALQITSHAAYDGDPRWTADSRHIVFASYREGSRDLFITSAKGGKVRRLTDFPGGENLMAVLPDGTVLFSASIETDKDFRGFPGYPQIYATNLEGVRPWMVTPLPMGNISVRPDGTVLYEDIKGVEDSFRKHHTSSVTRDIWLYEAAELTKKEARDREGRMMIDASGRFTRLSRFAGEDRNPVWAPSGQEYFYLSEADGTLNVYKASLRDGDKPVQLTFFRQNPVRYLSVADDGTLCFSQNGQLYTMKEGGEPVLLPVSITADNGDAATSLSLAMSGASSLAISPDGKEVAVISRGDVYVTTVELERTARITNTPCQERDLSFSSDGRTLYYASERDGCWSIFKSSLTDKKDRFFTFCTGFKEERVTEPGQTCFQPVVSPDGKWLAFLRDRSELVIKKTDGGKEKSLHKGINYSYIDGDLEFSWSPDSRYILTTWQADGGWNNENVAVIDIESGEIRDLTRSGYSDDSGRFAMGGKVMTWRSDRAGYRSHGSWGAEKDIYAMFFDARTYGDFIRPEEFEKEEKFLIEGDKKAEKKEEKDSLKAEKARFVPDFENLEDRTVRLTPYSGRIGDHYLSKDGKKLYYTMNDGKETNLYVLETKTRSLKVAQSGTSGALVPSKDEKYLFVLSYSGKISRIDVASGSKKSVSFKGWYEYDTVKEREYIFEHIWKQVEDKFYDKDFTGVDWKACHDNYRRFLPHINNNFDFSEMLSEMLGELNASHTGCRYYTTPKYNFGMLGVIYDDGWKGDGLKIAEVLPGSPLKMMDPEIQAGDVILSVNGKEIRRDEGWYKHFTAMGKRKLTLGIRKKNGKTEELYLAAAASEREMLYRRWVRRNEEQVRKLSGGKIGYVHVREMNSASFRQVYSKLLGEYKTCDAVVVDTRFNGGGWLHDDLATLLGGKEYMHFTPRGQYIGKDPYNKWTKPSCVLIGEANYSDASMFPYIYQALGLGKLVGAPVAGTGTAVWWEYQVDESLLFGIPQVTSIGLKDGRPLENLQVEPDIPVYNDPASLLRGEDRQIEAAVKYLMGLKQ